MVNKKGDSDIWTEENNRKKKMLRKREEQKGQLFTLVSAFCL